jgi:DNA-binding NtrC family response regulator
MENVVARLKVLKPEGDFQLADLPQAIRGAQPLPAIPQNASSLAATGVDLYAALGELEDRLIREALERSGGNRNQAAQSLGLNRTTLVEKLRKMSRR